MKTHKYRFVKMKKVIDIIGSLVALILVIGSATEGNLLAASGWGTALVLFLGKLIP